MLTRAVLAMFCTALGHQALWNGKKPHGSQCEKHLGEASAQRGAYIGDPQRIFIWERCRQEWATEASA